MKEAVSLLKNSKGADSTIFLVGNGGSAAIAEHIAIDLTKNAGLRALAISGTPMLTTFSNDYGYEMVFEKARGRRGLRSGRIRQAQGVVARRAGLAPRSGER